MRDDIDRLTWKQLRDQYVGGKYRHHKRLAHLPAKTISVIDVTLGGDVVVSYLRTTCTTTVSQATFVEWVQGAISLGKQIA
jgi:bifunctional ADP-heptose synthase (sugar kinase/adenylyltransferase)